MEKGVGRYDEETSWMKGHGEPETGRRKRVGSDVEVGRSTYFLCDSFPDEDGQSSHVTQREPNMTLVCGR